MVIQTNKGIKFLTEQEQEKMYLDYVNNFLTVAKFAEYYKISWVSAKSLINRQRKKVE